MRPSINIFVSIIVLLLFGASIISLYLALRQYNLLPLVLVAFVNIVAVAILVFLITRGVLKPLDHIRKIVKKVGEGDFRAQIPTNALQEIREFGETLNEMAQKIQKEKEELEEARATLEIQVNARTRELRELAEGLEVKIKERTQELEDKVRELERFQKLAVGRELRMTELKKEINQLRAKLL